MWDLIVSVPDHCLSFYFPLPGIGPVSKSLFHLHLCPYLSFNLSI